MRMYNIVDLGQACLKHEKNINVKHPVSAGKR